MSKRNPGREWPLHALEALAIAALVVMLAQPETWTFAAYFLDAGMLDVLLVLLQVQLGAALAPVIRHVLRPAWQGGREWLAGRRRTGRGPAISAVAKTFLAEWSGPLGAVLWLWMHERSREFCHGH